MKNVWGAETTPLKLVNPEPSPMKHVAQTFPLKDPFVAKRSPEKLPFTVLQIFLLSSITVVPDILMAIFVSPLGVNYIIFMIVSSPTPPLL